MRNVLIAAVCAVAVLVPGCGGGASSDEPILLHFDLEPGVTYVQNVAMELVVVVEMERRRGGGDLKAELDLRMPVSLAETPGHKLVRTTVEHLVAQARMQGRRLEYDSADAKNGDPMLAMVLDAVSSIDMVMELDETGQVVDVKGLDSLMVEGGFQGQDLMAEFLGDGNSGDLMNTWLLLGLPKEPVSKGDTWPIHTTVGGPTGEVVMNGTYEHRGTKKVNGVDCVVIGFDFQTDMGKLESADPQVKAMKSEIEDEGTTGRIFWDPVGNFPVRMEAKGGMTIRMNALMGKGRVEVPISMKLIADMSIEDPDVAQARD